MVKKLYQFVLWALFAPGLVLAGVPPGYYAAAEGATGHALRYALHQIIDHHLVVPYSSGSSTDTADVLKVLDEDPANTNNVILIYARRSEPKSTFGLTSGWNREHLWPNSYGLDDEEPAYCDLHNLRAADATVNSARGNKLFDESDPLNASYKTPGHAEAPLTSTDSDSWEPPDVVKGDIARAQFYMAVRYRGDAANEPALYLTEAVAQVGSSTNLMGRISTLLAWHHADPVDDRERRRNDLIDERYQHNRNPFVDRPEWADAAFGPVLTVQRVGNNIRVQWPAEYSGATVEVTSGFTSWSVLVNVPSLADGSYSLTLPVSGAQRCLRLRVR